MSTKPSKPRPIRHRVSSPFGENLKKILKERGITLRQASRIAGVNAATLHSWEFGGAPQDLSAVLKLCQELKVNFQWLLTGTAESTNLREATLSELFEMENDPTFSGLFMIEAKRLKRRGNSGEK